MADKKELAQFLKQLEEEFERVRPKIKPAYPIDEKTGEIHLPRDIERQLRKLTLAGNKPEAVKRVATLTGAGLRLSKDYVDSLIEKQP
jgi:ribosomal protein L7/L12